MVTVVEDAHIITPNREIPQGYVRIENGRITHVGSGSAPGVADLRIDARGRVLLPGLIDLHGDDLERFLAPRQEAEISPERALIDCDVASLAAGITTKLHAIAFEEAPGTDRSIDRAQELVDVIARTDTPVADHRIHARCELTDERSVDAVCSVMDEKQVDLVSLMTHIPGEGQFSDMAQFTRRYGDGRSDGKAVELGNQRLSVGSSWPGSRVNRIIHRASAADVPVASHDDEQPDMVERFAERGVDISEFPLSLPAARRATSLGLWTAMGAPNLVRGGSLWDNLDAMDAIDAGVVDILCSDYHPRSLLEAVFKDTGEQLPTRVARVTRHPAAALGYQDRGRIESGSRADMILVERHPQPIVRRVFLAGKQVYCLGSS